MNQTTMQWGLLGDEQLSQTRRVRTLNLGGVTRQFNSLAVPHIGSVRFGKQLLLPIIGIKLADDLSLNHSKIRIANAVESLACWICYKAANWEQSDNARGRFKLRRFEENLSFIDALKPSSYVSQPWRMSAGEAIRGLELIDSESVRFNSFSCNSLGTEFINKSLDQRVFTGLAKWVKGGGFPRSGKSVEQLNISNPLRSKGASWIKKTMVQHDRIASASSWVEKLNRDELEEFENNLDKEPKPEPLQDRHWADIYSGALFFQVQAAAETVLIGTEEIMERSSDRKLALESFNSEILQEEIEELVRVAHIFNDNRHDPTTKNAATIFCNELLDHSKSEIVENLVNRDGKLLKLLKTDAKGYVVPGPIFELGIRGARTKTSDESEDDEMENKKQSSDNDDLPIRPTLPVTLYNLLLLTSDLKSSG